MLSLNLEMAFLYKVRKSHKPNKSERRKRDALFAPSFVTILAALGDRKAFFSLELTT